MANGQGPLCCVGRAHRAQGIVQYYIEVLHSSIHCIVSYRIETSPKSRPIVANGQGPLRGLGRAYGE